MHIHYLLEANDLPNWSDVLIVVTKYSKFKSEATVWLLLNCYMSVNSFLLLYYIYLDTVVRRLSSDYIHF